MTKRENFPPNYCDLTVQWQPARNADGTYRWLVVGCVAAALLVGALLRGINVPEPERMTRADIPERVARYITERPRPEPEPAEPPPERRPPPVVEPRPVVERERPEREAAPLTEAQQEARERAAQTGLLAMGEQLDSLMDTSDVDALVDTQSSARTSDAQTASGYSGTEVLTAAGRADSAGPAPVSAVAVGESRLARRELAAVSGPEEVADEGGGDEVRRASFAETGRSEEEVSLVFDQNRGTLYSLYNRARRQHPGLEGRLVLEVTIEPTGEVTAVDVVSSELNNPSLEQQIRHRVLQFRFEQRQAETITIIYPIEFLPS
ncbi:AgmX/PglI C-terminal domain-containing protein [Marinimicrobium alkaliphilum]|uniref:AgmX/PglI C-terminal domain-containing protein n=1 Tax=Marinimicrobium alkaliphilum TaxID=2202654 RepID=UPI000DBA07D3|nr:AgmX/PglI C-terminal domain-containing protein [Marinimicrobium alkaliphilum]